MSKKGSKNIFANILLTLSLVLSVLGGTFLMSVAKQDQLKKAFAVDGDSPVSKGLTFISTSNSQTASGLTADGQYEYESSTLNYVDIKGLLYYANGDKLYSDTIFTREAKDFSYAVDATEGAVVVGTQSTILSGSFSYNGNLYYVKDSVVYSDSTHETKVTAFSYIVKGEMVTIGNKYILKNDISMFSYNNATYFYKNGMIYDSINCNNAFNRDYDIAFEFKTTIGEKRYSGTNSIERVIINSVNYYKTTLTTPGSADIVVYSQTKSANYNRLYKLDDENLTELTECQNTTVTPKTIYVHTTLPTAGSIAEDYIDVFGEKYYIHDGNIYSKPYYIAIDKTKDPDSKIATNTNNSITFKESILADTAQALIKGVTYTFNKVEINNNPYYVNTSSTPSQPTYINDFYSLISKTSCDVEISDTNKYLTSTLDTSGVQTLNGNENYYPTIFYNTITGKTNTYYVKITDSNTPDLESVYTFTDLDNLAGSISSKKISEVLSGITSFKIDTTALTATYSFNSTEDNGQYFLIPNTSDGKDVYVKGGDTNFYTLTKRTYNEKDYYVVKITNVSDVYITKNQRNEDTGNYEVNVIYKTDTSQFESHSILRDENAVTVTISSQYDSRSEYQYVEYKNVKFYIIKNEVKKPDTTIEESKLSRDANGYYHLISTFNISTSTAEQIQITEGARNVVYNRVLINNNTYYVIDGNPKLYTITGEGTTLNPYISSEAKNLNFEYLIDDKVVIASFKYQLNGKSLYILTSLTQIATNYFTYDTQYYYYDNKLYLQQPSSTDINTTATLQSLEMKDFDYSSVVSAITLNNYTYPVETAEYTTVMLDGKQYYLDNNTKKLYTTMYLCHTIDGVAYRIKYEGEVNKGFFDYRIDNAKKIVTIFTGSPQIMTENTEEDAVTIFDKKSKYSFTSGATNYYVTDGDTEGTYNFYIKANTLITGDRSGGKLYYQANGSFHGLTLYVSRADVTSSVENAIYIKASVSTITTINNATIEYSKSTNQITINITGSSSTSTSVSNTSKWAYYNGEPKRLFSFQYDGKDYFFEKPDSPDNPVPIETIYSVADNNYINITTTSGSTTYLKQYFIKTDISYATDKYYYVDIFNPTEVYDDAYRAVSGVEVTVDPVTGTATIDGTNTVLKTSVLKASTSSIIAVIDDFEIKLTEKGTLNTTLSHASAQFVKHDILNINIEISFETGNNFFVDNNFNMPNAIIINGKTLTKINDKDTPFPANQTSSLSRFTSNDIDNSFLVYKTELPKEEGSDEYIKYYTIMIKYNKQYYSIYCGFENSGDINVYYYNKQELDKENGAVVIYTQPRQTDILINVTNADINEKGYSFKSFKDFIIVKTTDDKYALYNTDTYYAYTDDSKEITFKNKYVVVEEGGTYILKDKTTNVEAKRINFDYVVQANSVNNQTTETKTFKYILSNGTYYVLDDSNQVYEYFRYSIDSIMPMERGLARDDAKRIANQVYVDSTAKNYDILSSNGKGYAENQDALKSKAQYDNGSVIMLQNYLNAYELKTSVTEITKEIENVYIQIGSKNVYDETNIPTISSGITALSVQAFLKNEETAQYATKTEGFFDQNYGLRIKINSEKSEEVYYTSQSGVKNTNFYWYNYFDLKGIEAIVRVGTSGEAQTYPITDASGYYTIVFTYSYIDENGNISAGNIYTYSFYLSDNSNYVEYPTFGTTVQDDEDSTKVKTIVDKTNAGNQVEYRYNFQSFDIPTYIYNATKYNVGYSFRFNLDAREYTTEFKIYNTATTDISKPEYGQFNLYRNGTLDTALRLVINESERAIDYYTSNGDLFGSLYISNDGIFKLSLENYTYYNSKNKSDYTNVSDYYKAGRVIKCGAKNTVVDYYVVLLLEELGSYQFKNVRLISAGANASFITTFENYPQDVLSSGANDILESRSKTQTIDLKEITFKGADTLRFGRFDNGFFTFDPEYGTITTEGEYPSNSNASFKVYGVNTRFKKNNNTINFRKLDENIYSDVTANSVFYVDADTSKGTIDVKDLLNNPQNLTSLYFDNSNYYAIPLTNLQPIYFNSYANILYGNSSYVRYTSYNYSTYDNGHLKSVTVDNTRYTQLNYTNKTSISQSGLYIVKIEYSNDATSGINCVQYFMFVIDNTAPNMEILVHDKSTDAGTVFISNTQLLSTSRYTNKNYISINYVNPNYFQGDVKVGYKITSYDQLTTLREGTCNNGSIMATMEGRYTFTIYYGVNSLSYNSTYVIVDKSAPTGSLYDVDTETMQYTSSYDSYAFSKAKVFVTNRIKTGSGATVYAKLKTISLESFSMYAEQLDKDYNAITTNVMLVANNSLFDNIDMSDSPTYNFKTPDSNNVDMSVTNGQVLGLTNQTTIYILKLYDSAGNEAYYYYFYDTSSPYLLYLDKNTASATPRKSLENNTTQSNTSVIWGNYKAIYIDTTDAESNNLYSNFIDKVSRESSKYNRMTVNEVDGKTYLYVPISRVNVSAMLSGKEQSASTPNTGNFVNSAVVYTKKYANRNGSMENLDRNWTLENASIKEMFSDDKSYKFEINDAFGNLIQKVVTMNSSFAQESFNGDYNNTTYPLIDGTNKAYSLDKINVKYRALDDSNSVFKPQVTFDYYAFNFENFLKQKGTPTDNDKIVYNNIAYDTEFGNVYKFSDSKYYLCNDINSYTIDDSNPDNGKSWEELNSLAKGKLFTANYPFSLTASNQEIEVNKSYENGTYYQASTIVNEQNSKTAPGLYVFRRIYIYNSTGQMITQDAIDTAGDSSDLSVLSEDYAIRYYVYYIDRNNIIDLTYLQSSIDNVSSIGDFLQILLGSGDNNSKITAEILKTYEQPQTTTNNVDIITNKLRVNTDFPIDKYATANKLKHDSSVADDQKLVGYNTSDQLLLNTIGENFSIENNQSVFKYRVSLKTSLSADKDYLIKDNEILDANLVGKLASGNNYSLFKDTTYQLVISDSANFSYSDDNLVKSTGGNTYIFNFAINHSSPEGAFQTKANDVAGTIEDLEVRTQMTTPNQNGKEVVYKNINKDYLQFSFSESLSVYDAEINPYNVKVLKDGNVLFTTKKSEDKGTLLSTFENSTLPQGVKLEDVLIIEEGDGANIPTTYTIRIFDKNSTSQLLSKAEDNSTYKVIVEYIGSQADYTITVNGKQANFFTTSFEITVDTTAPSYNQNRLADIDKNLDYYCMAEYGKRYALLSDTEKSDLLKKYVFAVSYLTSNYIDGTTKTPETKDSLVYWAKKDGISNTDELIKRNMDKIISNHSTVFEYSYNDSVKLYYRTIGDNLNNYTMSYLPNEEGENKLLIFNKYDTDTYRSLEYTHSLTSMPDKKVFSFSKAFTSETGEPIRILSDGYYEFFEEDEAGNLSRYLVYICDNTFAEYGIDYLSKDRNTVANDDLYYTKTDDGTILYINKIIAGTEPDIEISFSVKDYLGNTIQVADEDITRNSDNIPTQIKINDVIYTIYKVYNQSGFYIEDSYTIIENDGYGNQFVVRDENKQSLINDAKVTYSAYYTLNDSFKLVPTSVLLDNANELTGISGFKSFMAGTIDPVALFRITGISPLLLENKNHQDRFDPNEPGISKHIFDQFITVNLYSGVKRGDDYTFTLSHTLTSNPYKQTTEEFFNYVVVMLQNLVLNSEGIYSYKLEIVNRFNDNYNIIVDLPDSELKLTFATLDDNLVVSLPNPSTNVKILEFRLHTFVNGQWTPLIRDIHNKDIISKNLDDPDTGLKSTTYTLGKGSYRFYILDNYDRTDTTYKNVGQADDTISTTFSKKYIQNGNNYITSSDMNIILDANLYQIKFGIKDCITYTIVAQNLTYSLSVFNTMVGEFNSNNVFTPWVLSETSNEYVPLTSITSIDQKYYYLYYLNGKVYYGENYTPITDDVFVCKVKAEDCFTSSEIKAGSDIGKTVYTLKILYGEVNNFVYTLNWATDPENITTYTVKIDKTMPVVKFISDTNQQVAPNGNYYKQFQITWTSNYSTTGTLTYTYNATTTTTNISALDYYTVSKIGGYTLRIVDEIGNEYSISFYMVSAGNNYFSVFINNTLEIFESEFVEINNSGFDKNVINTADNKTVKYFYYLKNDPSVNDTILVKPDETKGIKAVKINPDGSVNTDADGVDVLYKIYRVIGGENYTICYARIIAVNKTTQLKDFIVNIETIDKNDNSSQIPSSTMQKEYTFTENYSKINLKLNSYNTNSEGSASTNKYKGNKVFARHYYNGALVKTYSASMDSISSNTSNYTITITTTGIHTFDIYDFVGNKLDTISITLIKNVMYTTNNESPISNRFYNDSVTINIPEMKQFYDTVNLYATYNGIKYGKDATDSEGNALENINNIATIINNSYTFTQSGYYEITITATGTTTTSSGEPPKYVSTYCFTIVNPNVTKMTFGFSSSYGFNIVKLMKNELDITNTLTSDDSLWLTSGKEDSAGTYTITLTGYDYITNEYLPFTFTVKINNEIPSILPIKYTYGTSTTKQVMLQYNPALIYSQVGESYIQISKNSVVQGTIDIDSTSLDELATIAINQPGKWTVSIYNKDGNYIASYTVNKATPLNSSAKLIIIIAVVVVIALAITFIVLRKHTKFR